MDKYKQRIADKFAYRREDGVYVVPLGCLRE